MSQCQKVGGGYEGGLKGRNREKYCNYNSISKLSETYAVFKYINKIRVLTPMHRYFDILFEWIYGGTHSAIKVFTMSFLCCWLCPCCSLQSGTLNHRVEACIIDTQDHGENCRRNRLHMSLKSMTEIVVMKIWGRAWVMGVPKAVGSVFNGPKH